MTYRFSQHSLGELSTLHSDLQEICNYGIKWHDFKVQEGYRDERKQNEALMRGTTKVSFPNSRHNSFPSEAMDLLPFLDGKFIGWPDQMETRRAREKCWAQWHYFGGQVCGWAQILWGRNLISHTLRWGHDWNKDNNLTNQSFIDAPHFELIKTQTIPAVMTA